VTDIIVTNDAEQQGAIRLMQNRKKPYTLTIRAGKHRTNQQNNLQWKWAVEISEQLGEDTPSAVQAFFKLHFGVPLLRAESEEFREVYDRLVKPLSYEDKLIFMERLGFSVSSLLTTKQMTQYLDAIYTEFTGRGVRLTRPDGDEW